MSGYQSNIDLKDVNLVGDIPVENTTGGYGETGGNSNAYTLSLDPPLTTYRVGLPLQVKFHAPNTDVPSLNVNGLGIVPIKKIVKNALIDLAAGDLDVNPIYDLKYDGVNFQVVTGLTPQVDTPDGTFILRGSIDASTFPEFPPAKKGDLYRIIAAGVVGDSDANPGLTVAVGDVVYAIEDNDGGVFDVVGDKWNALSGK